MTPCGQLKASAFFDRSSTDAHAGRSGKGHRLLSYLSLLSDHVASSARSIRSFVHEPHVIHCRHPGSSLIDNGGYDLVR